MSYIMAQFMDIIFTDKRPIADVLTGRDANGNSNKYWEKRGRGLRDVYPVEVYSRVLELREQAKQRVGNSIETGNVSSLISFVASYKIRYNSK